MLIRDATRADTPGLVALKRLMAETERGAFAEGSALQDERDLSADAAAAGIEDYFRCIAEHGGRFLVAERDATLLGCVCWFRIEAGPSVRAEHRSRAMLAGLVVAPTARGTGVGKRLVAEVESQAKAAGLTRLSLGVIAGNAAAIGLYEQQGFVPFEMRMVKILQ